MSGDLREAVALALLVARSERYAADEAMLREHWGWYLAGASNPESCVHYSAQGLAARDADAILARLRERGALVPDGWRAVPVEPTEAMLRDGTAKMRYLLKNPQVYPRAYSCYAAMLAAAPAPTTGER